ncbi:MAG: hypothetical protein R3C28_17890 [Pirellulaceae bacterium]
MVHDQAETLRRRMSQRTIRSVDSVRDCRISMFLGAKSSVGTTSLVSNLAVSLARRNNRILVIDSQCNSPDIARHCRISSVPALAALCQISEPCENSSKQVHAELTCLPANHFPSTND